MIGLDLSVPRWSGEARAEIDAAEAMRARAGFEAEALGLALSGRLGAAEVRLAAAAARYALAQERLLPVAAERRDAAHAGWIAGLEPLSEVLAAERAQRTAQLQALQALAAWTDAHTTWVRAAGHPEVSP